MESPTTAPTVKVKTATATTVELPNGGQATVWQVEYETSDGATATVEVPDLLFTPSTAHSYARNAVVGGVWDK